MRRRAGFVVACVAALAVCSCAPQAELDRARAEADAARADAERARAELEAVQEKEAAAEKAAADAAKRRAALDEALAQARERWNAVGAGVKVGNFQPFRWDEGRFPHPTFRGGSKEAYTAFAQVLVTFLETGDNFEFMEKHGLFTAELECGLNTKIVLVQFAGDLAKPGSLGAGDEETRNKLEALVAKMKAPRKV